MAQHLLLLKQIQVSYLQPLSSPEQAQRRSYRAVSSTSAPYTYLHADQPITTEPNPICVKSSKQSIFHSFLTRKFREWSPFICCNRYAGAALQSPHYSVFKHYAGRFFLAEADGLSMN